MKIISYNVNGIRAAIKKGLIEWIRDESPDVLCIQETKAQQEQVEPFHFIEAGYTSYWFSAQKKGYSGVAIFTKKKPDHVEYGMGIPEYDFEGRMIRADYGDISIISVYHPSGTSGDARQAFKMEWLSKFQEYIHKLRETRPNLIICGDYNICHKAIDIHDPKGNANSSGFLPEEREWIDGFINSGYIDSFRHFNAEPHNYSWWSYRFNSRDQNKGWRIDYNLVSESLRSKLVSASILPDALHSDHCPVVVELSL